MGWFTIIDEDYPNRDMVIGDDILDIFGDAVERIISIYPKGMGRPPCREEIEYALSMVIGGKELNEELHQWDDD